MSFGAQAMLIGGGGFEVDDIASNVASYDVTQKITVNGSNQVTDWKDTKERAGIGIGPIANFDPVTYMADGGGGKPAIATGGAPGNPVVNGPPATMIGKDAAYSPLNINAPYSVMFAFYFDSTSIDGFIFGYGDYPTPGRLAVYCVKGTLKIFPQQVRNAETVEGFQRDFLTNTWHFFYIRRRADNRLCCSIDGGVEGVSLTTFGGVEVYSPTRIARGGSFQTAPSAYVAKVRLRAWAACNADLGAADTSPEVIKVRKLWAARHGTPVVP